jgi:hypothetical protein
MPLSQEPRSGIFAAHLVGLMCFMGLIFAGASMRKNHGPYRTVTPKAPKPSVALTKPQAEREGVTWTARDLAQFLRNSRAVVPNDLRVQAGVRDGPVSLILDVVKKGNVVLQLIQFDTPQKAQDFFKDQNRDEGFVWGRFAIVGDKPQVEAARKALVKKVEDAED